MLQSGQRIQMPEQPISYRWPPKNWGDPARLTALDLPQLSLSLNSLDEWTTVAEAHPFLFSADYVEEIVRLARSHGIYSKFFREHISPHQVTVLDNNYRESLLGRGLNCRQRTVLDLLAEEPGTKDVWKYSIYAPEALTPFALLLRGRFPRFAGSEYAETPEQRRALLPIPFENLVQLTFPDDLFDCVIANEVFEHISDLNRGLREICRVLKPSGALFATFPFRCNDYEHTVKARVVNAAIEYLDAPEYHGNPVDPVRGSLVFQVPGWQILDDCRAAGFGRAEFVFVSSPYRGITGTEYAGVHVLRCRK